MQLMRFFKIFVLSLTLICGYAHASPSGAYAFFNLLGHIHDLFWARGDLSEKHTAMFNELAEKLGIDKREIKVKNAGFLTRFFWLYNNALASQLFHRVYINEDWLNQMTDDEKRFLMAQKLVHHSKHQGFKWLSAGLLTTIFQNSMIYHGIDNHWLNTRMIHVPLHGFRYNGVNGLQWPVIGHERREVVRGTDNYLKKYISYGFLKSPRYLDFIFQFSLWQLLYAKYCHHLLTQADQKAMEVANVTPEVAASALRHFYNPNTDNWPGYAKIQAFFQHIILSICSLPIIKEHFSLTQPYYEGRIKDLYDNAKPIEPAKT